MSEGSAFHAELPVPDQAWWLEKWAEREKAITEAYGESEFPGAPPGTVIGFPEDLRAEGKFPGGSILGFPPKPEAKRPHWIFTTLGLSQPIKADDVRGADADPPAPSRLGFEFAVTVKEPGDWTIITLFALARFALNPPGPVRPGARVPFFFAKPKADAEATVANVVPALGAMPAEHVPSGDTVSLLLWPALDRDGPFVTSTGRFDLLVATAVTQDEWELAKATTTGHLVLLLVRSGLHQSTDPLRASILADERWRKEWEAIKGLSRDAVLDALYGPA